MLPFINFYLFIFFFLDNSLYYQMKHDFCRNFCASLLLLLFYICFCSLLINTRLVFISYFVSVPLRKGHRGLEYQCSFVRLYLFLFAFLIICIEPFCIFDYLYRDFWFLVDFFETIVLPFSIFKNSNLVVNIAASNGRIRIYLFLKSNVCLVLFNRVS